MQNTARDHITPHHRASNQPSALTPAPASTQVHPVIPHACSSWVAVDLGPHRALVPTAYCLLHGSQRRGNALRHWEFQV